MTQTPVNAPPVHSVPAVQKPALSQARKVNNAVERLDLLEKQVDRMENILKHLVKVIDDQSLKTRANIVDLELSMDTLVNHLVKIGIVPGSIQDFWKAFHGLKSEIAQQKEIAKAEAAKKQLEKDVADGKLVVSEVIGPNSLVVCRAYDKDNKSLGTGRIQLAVVQFGPPEIQKLIIGKKVLDSVEMPDGGRLEIGEIYDIAPQLTAKPETVGLAVPAPPEVAAEPTPEAKS